VQLVAEQHADALALQVTLDVGVVPQQLLEQVVHVVLVPAGDGLQLPVRGDLQHSVAHTPGHDLEDAPVVVLVGKLQWKAQKELLVGVSAAAEAPPLQLWRRLPHSG
jgi:hypothetical protein